MNDLDELPSGFRFDDDSKCFPAAVDTVPIGLRDTLRRPNALKRKKRGNGGREGGGILSSYIVAKIR